MKKYLIPFVLLFPLFNFSQPNTEVFLFDLNQENGTIQLSNFRNISNNEGYDNQPSFLDNNTILYARTRNGQTDIVEYTISTGEKHWVCETEGGEYSPLKIPNQDAVSAIRLDKDGTQLLRQYNLENGESEVLVDNLVIGYHVWYSDIIILSSVLEDEGLSLYVTNLKTKENHKIEANVGRSLHNIPSSNLVSYISKAKDSIWDIKSVNPTSGATTFITNTLPITEDMCWLTSNTLLMGKENKLYKFQVNEAHDWNEVASLSSYGITNITRLAVSLDGTKLVLVAEVLNN